MYSTIKDELYQALLNTCHISAGAQLLLKQLLNSEASDSSGSWIILHYDISTNQLDKTYNEVIALLEAGHVIAIEYNTLILMTEIGYDSSTNDYYIKFNDSVYFAETPDQYFISRGIST